MTVDLRRILPHPLLLLAGGLAAVVTGMFVLRRPAPDRRAWGAVEDELAESESSWLEWRGAVPAGR